MVDSLNPDVMRKNIRDLNVKNNETLYQVGELENVVGATTLPEGATLTNGFVTTEIITIITDANGNGVLSGIDFDKIINAIVISPVEYCARIYKGLDESLSPSVSVKSRSDVTLESSECTLKIIRFI